ncbi:MAG: methionine synthase [Methanobrevibacter sp.]|nr:methionine synthase [Methanobrevibacter sp.]MEA4957205.1 methionine synthase [Methanobrevibacter sp.]
MLSTVVGSYPVYLKENKSIKGKILSNIGAYDSYKLAIRHAVDSQLKAGIDIISDGQVRGEMVEIFAKSIPGFEIEGNTYHINSKIYKHNKSIGASDLKLAIKYMEEFLSKSDDISPEEKSKKGVKGIITGPSTIIQSSKLGPIYKDKNKAIIDMAYALREEAIALEKAGAKLIQIDEPFLSTGLIDMEVAKEAIDIITMDINIPVSLHCCGDIKNVFKDLISFNISIIDCEFAGHPNNIDILKENADYLIKNGKKVGLGVIDTKKQSIESIEEISKIIDKGIRIMGKKNLLIDPDCGMKLLPDDIAFGKLKNMVKAMNLKK